jgi:hypothetical protein
VTSTLPVDHQVLDIVKIIVQNWEINCFNVCSALGSLLYVIVVNVGDILEQYAFSIFRASSSEIMLFDAQQRRLSYIVLCEHLDA